VGLLFSYTLNSSVVGFSCMLNPRGVRISSYAEPKGSWVLLVCRTQVWLGSAVGGTQEELGSACTLNPRGVGFRLCVEPKYGRARMCPGPTWSQASMPYVPTWS
jgi:hypothetical protein